MQKLSVLSRAKIEISCIGNNHKTKSKIYPINLPYYYSQPNWMPELMYLILEDSDKFYFIKRGYQCV